MVDRSAGVRAARASGPRSLCGPLLLLVFGLVGACGGSGTEGDDAVVPDGALPPGCGNGVVEPGEQCDGADFAGQTCLTAAGHIHGELRCTETCERDLSGCHTCGNGRVERSEECEPNDLRGMTCLALTGLRHGEPGCDESCRFDPGGCHECGNGVVEGPEECDGPDTGLGCADMGMSGQAEVTCSFGCQLQTDGCYECGDGVCSSPHETAWSCPDECAWEQLVILSHSICGLRRDGSVACWGCAIGPLGDADTPTTIPGLTDVVSLTAGSGHACALRSNGRIWCWGSGGYSDTSVLGGGTLAVGTGPVQVVGLQDVVAVDAGWSSNCALRSDGTVWCWGSIYESSYPNYVPPTPVPVQVAGLQDVVAVAAGLEQWCAIVQGGAVWCWGNTDFDSSWGNPDYTPWVGPEAVAGIPHGAEALALGLSHACALVREVPTADPRVVCWGKNEDGQLGIGYTSDATEVISTPTEVVGLTGAAPIVDIESQMSSTCARSSDGSVRCWGASTTSRSPGFQTEVTPSATAIPGLSGAEQLCVSDQTACAVDGSGVGWCWGVSPFAFSLCEVDAPYFNHVPSPLCVGPDCHQCGNGLREPLNAEACEPGDLGGLACTDLCGFTGGTLACGPGCELDTSGCTGGPVCGNGVAECDEVCDGADLRGLGCADVGYTGGTLACGAGCAPDPSQCTGQMAYLVERFEGPTALGWSKRCDWEVGAPVGEDPLPTDGSTGLAGTALGGEYRALLDVDHCGLISPPVDLSAATAPWLTFQHSLWLGNAYDGAVVSISTNDGASWIPVPAGAITPSYDSAPACAGGEAFSGSTDWRRVSADLSAFVGQTIRVRFSLCSDSRWAALGWYVDNVLVVEQERLPVDQQTDPGLGLVLADAPFSRQLEAIGGSGSYQWSIVGGSNHLWLSVDPATGLLAGTPTAGDAGPVTVTVRAADAGNPLNYHDRTFTMEVLDALLMETFEQPSLPPGWIATGDWELGNPASNAYGFWPTECNGGSVGCMGTDMLEPYTPDRPFGSTTLVTPGIDLTAAPSPVLIFFTSWAVDIAAGALIEVTTTGGVSWFALPTRSLLVVPMPLVPPGSMCATNEPEAFYVDTPYPDWTPIAVDLSPYIGSVIRLRFSFCSDPGFGVPRSATGWLIDDVAVFPDLSVLSQ